MQSKNCTFCDIEKEIEDLFNKYTAFKNCNCNKSLNRYYENKDKISNQKKDKL